MVTFKQYLLNENILSGVRASILGLTVSQELPPSPPYGFWVDRSGNYITVTGFSTGGHAGAAKQMILAAYDYKDETNQLISAEESALNTTLKKGFGALYDVLFEMNFMHIVKGGNKYFYKVNSLTSSQQKFLKILTETYKTESERVYDIL